MKKTRNFVISFAVLTALLVAAFSMKAKKTTQTPLSSFSLNIVSEPASLDPRKARSLNDLNVIKMCLEGLTRTSQDLTPSLALAESIRSGE